MSFLDRLVSNPLGAFGVLALAALLEAWGDSLLQSSFYRSTGTERVLAFVAGAIVLAGYGSVVNLPRWEFGRLIGAYEIGRAHV